MSLSVGVSDLGLSEALVIALSLHGAILPQYGEEPEVRLGLPGLLLIEELWRQQPDDDLVGRVAAATGADESHLSIVLDELRRRNLLVGRGEPPPGAPAGTIPVAPAGGPAADIGDEDQLVLPSPVLLRCRDGAFQAADHDGNVRVELDARELNALLQFQVGCRIDQAYDAQRNEAGSLALDRTGFDDAVRRGLAGELLLPLAAMDLADDRQDHQAEAMRESIRSKGEVNQAFDRLEREAGEIGHDGRMPVMGIHSSWASAPASLGMVLAYARRYDDGALNQDYDFRPRLAFDPDRLAATSAHAGVYLFSNYIWNSDENLRLSALVKQNNPNSLTIHGGPNTPKFAPDVKRFFADNPHVDIAVHGEGEVTFVELLAALAGNLGKGPPDLEPLSDVPGLTFRRGEEGITTGKRDRVADLDVLPSPILEGLFDAFIPAGPLGGVAIETNRGCPYGCTFCDWGSATLSRVRKFDLDRVFAELEWCAKSKIQTIGICDANFGIFERDVEIAEKIAELKATYGYPIVVGNNYAKNTVKHLSKIIEIFTEAGIVAEGKMSMQSFDAGTLEAINRKNIKVEKYDELSGEFRRNRLPLSVDLMLGLPGSTRTTFSDDLQACVDRDVRVIIHPTMLLPNSPMNDPEYRREHGIVARPGEVVEEAASFTHEEWEQMHRLGAGVWLFENFGMLRQVATYIRAETGLREVDFYDRLITDAETDPERWPMVLVAINVLPHAMVPPVSWNFFLENVRRHALEIEGITDDLAFQTVLDVQHALLPARGRPFPIQVPLAHDYVAWRAEVLDARDHGHRDDWHRVVTPLREFGPGTLPVDDPYRVCSTALDGSLTALAHESSWDFDSPVSRPRQRTGATAATPPTSPPPCPCESADRPGARQLDRHHCRRQILEAAAVARPGPGHPAHGGVDPGLEGHARDRPRRGRPAGHPPAGGRRAARAGRTVGEPGGRAGRSRPADRW